MSEHDKPTPGPWRYDWAADVVLSNKTGAYVARPYSPSKTPEGEVQANARLMAAAYLLPELREVLACVLGMAEAHMDSVYGERGQSPHCKQARDLLARLDQALGRRDA